MEISEVVIPVRLLYPTMPEKVSFPPTTVVTPDGERCPVVGAEGGGAYVVYEHNGEEKRIDWSTLSDPLTEWQFEE